jgi:hypothetical protein
VPDDDGDGSENALFEEFAMIALIYALRVAAGAGVQEAIWAARQPIDALNQVVADRHGFRRLDAHAIRVLDEDPTVCREVERQNRDLAELAATLDASPAVVDAFRLRALEEGQSFRPT